MTTELIEGGALFAKLEDRTVSGILMPWGERSRPNATGQPPIVFERGTIKLPRDISIVSANIQHDRFTPVARATSLEETDEGLVATFAVAETDEGDDLLLQISEGKLSKLSAEVKNLVVSAGRAVSAALTGAAFVKEGAFAGAALFSIAAGEDELTDDEKLANAQAVIDAITTAREAATKATEEAAAPPATPSAEDTKKEDDVTVATVPTTTETTATQSAPEGGASLFAVANALAMFSARGDRAALTALSEADTAFSQGETAMFALNDVKLTTAGSVGVNIQQPQWIGELWRGRSFQRRIIPLLSQAALTSFKVKGFKWLVEPSMAAWAGDKAAVPSNTPTTEGYNLDAQRWAGGHDIAREYRDFDVPEFWEAYFRAMTDSYAKITDDAALVSLVAGATAVTAGVVPAGVNPGLVSIVDGALAVLDTGAPSYAIVAKDVFRSIALMKDIDKLAFLNTSLGLEEGTLTSFRVVPHSGIAAGKALVGVGAAATYYELPGSPIRTEALDQIKGGIDEALFGYSATGINRPAGLALVTPAA